MPSAPFGGQEAAVHQPSEVFARGRPADSRNSGQLARRKPQAIHERGHHRGPGSVSRKSRDVVQVRPAWCGGRLL
ncbi:hypothetical protein FNJ62_08350 [Streptomyces benahoarensis]|nr:hypothetical protein [Streptomyces benahoarensis]TSB30089.1 hypothetical protein FNJ62_08350 [Streptomyces benahoarensis]